jgi:putative endonuclease
LAEYHFYVYIMASRSLTLYIGFTSNLEVRVCQHKDDVFDGFSQTYQCHRLVYFECFQNAPTAIAREKQLKRWSRAKKIALIKTMNPAWADLSEEWGKAVEPFREPRAD